MLGWISPNTLQSLYFLCITYLYYFSSNVIHLSQNEAIKCKFFSSAGSKLVKFLMSFFKARVIFSSNLASFFSDMIHNSLLFHIIPPHNILPTHNIHIISLRALKLTKFLMSLKTLHVLGKRSHSECKFSDFRLLVWKLTKFFMSFFKPQVCFPLNFASLFSVMTHNFSESF